MVTHERSIAEQVAERMILMADVPPPDLLMREIVDWLDRYLGPVHQ